VSKSNNRIGLTKLGKGVSKINPTPTQPPSRISFSYKYLETQNSKFPCGNGDIKYWTTFIKRLKAISSMTAKELQNNNSKALRCHRIDWAETTEKNGFGIPKPKDEYGKEIENYDIAAEAYQFAITANECGRVHGFFIEEIFYIVWLDPNHLLYESKE